MVTARRRPSFIQRRPKEYKYQSKPERVTNAHGYLVFSSEVWSRLSFESESVGP